MKNKDIRKKFQKTFDRKSQVWISDYTLSLLLFTLAVIISIKILINSFAVNTDFKELKTDAAKISEILLSEGYPPYWDNGNSSDIIRLGLLTGERLSESKLIRVMNASYINYTSLRPKLQTKYDFVVVFEKPNGSLIEFNNLCVIGRPNSIADCTNPALNLPDYDNLVKLTRLVIYNSTITRMVIYTWNT